MNQLKNTFVFKQSVRSAHLLVSSFDYFPHSEQA